MAVEAPRHRTIKFVSKFIPGFHHGSKGLPNEAQGSSELSGEAKKADKKLRRFERNPFAK